MKIFKQGLGLALVGAGLVVVPGLQSGAVGRPAPDRPLVQQMRTAADGAVTMSREPGSGRVGFVRARRDLLPGVDARGARGAAAKASAYLGKYAAAFGARPAELERSEVRETVGGWTVSYAQTYRGVPVFGAELRAHVDEQGDLTAVNGFAVPDLDLGVTPHLTRDEATTRAVDLVRDDPAEQRGTTPDASALHAASTDLMVYRRGSTRGVEGPALLAWVVEVTDEHTVRETVILDARTGKSVNRWSMIAHAVDRELYEGSLAPDNLVWSEGSAFPGDLDPDQSREVLGAGETYWMFANTFGYDSYDGADATMVTVNNDPQIRCPNANWNGVSTNYCTDVSSDDTVAHEWAHAYTEYTSGLVYQWQSGAMNEAYSDIWGETVDLLNDRQDVDQDQQRLEGECSAYSPPGLAVEITAPASVAGPCQAVAASGGPEIPAEPLTPDVVVGTDDATSGSTTDGCSAFDNAAAIAGNWVYVDENFGPDGCSYTSQGERAVDAGATGIIIGSDPAYAPFDMPGDTFDIYAMQVDGGSGDRFKEAGTATISVTAVPQADPSARWLSGEEDAAFGGAIRDLWNPTCYGHPGKVSDEEYYCDSTDSGGVHSNSGVVNHTYALLVDGSTYNGVTVPAIGLDKAAHLFWHTQRDYLTSVSDFGDLADGLAASCTDLLGEEINAVTLGDSETGGGPAEPAAAEPIDAADCAAVDAVVQAVELDQEPVQCEFGPILAKDTPSLCGDDFTTDVVWSEDFEDGLAGWTQDEELVYEGTEGIPWEPTTSAPGGHAGGVAYAPDPDEGTCQGDAGDISGRNGLVSPSVTFPVGTSPTLSFDHYVATETGYDGANVKVSVDGGPFALVPTDAYVFNAPGADLETEEADNTNPMAGQPAFTGTDGGESHGSWGTSLVALDQIEGAAPGDELVFRFDSGRDGCGGVDGWYVDDVQVSVCQAKAASKSGSTTVARTRKRVRFTQDFTVRTHVTRDAGGRASGAVRVFFHGKPVARGRLDQRGRAKVLVRKNIGPGNRTLVVRYRGNRTTRPSKDVVRIRVLRRR